MRRFLVWTYIDARRSRFRTVAPLAMSDAG
jgi:hypothetical protein